MQGESENEKYQNETSADSKSWRILKDFEIKSSIRTMQCNHHLLLRFLESTDSKRSIIPIKHQLCLTKQVRLVCPYFWSTVLQSLQSKDFY